MRTLRQLRGDLHHAHIIPGVALKVVQRPLDLGNQLLRLTIGIQHLQQALHPEQLLIRATGIYHPVGQ